ncbi:ComEA family DNA-binding protein [Pseudoalteromonas sp. 1_2015MBL_MicDiv]|uniref:ComEA family DNA-binding protein n=1 Tax=Pseudoalteromonas sp. 1_2015MBL_MicDiv TaxID=1720343 RepID=UPI000BBEAA95|nr:ComEA family DNA-binding protein [Pseudoalteromonas sp. 1_2015MBL_MicDiv]ATG76891.1 competence protein ComEA [Pseudoalteromonas sp. 1_2015MBL_MicDiv]
MRLLQKLLFISILCLLPTTAAFSQVVDVVKEMPKYDVVSINDANASMLAKLPGIGKKKAQAIVDYREANGEFTEVNDLAKVKGVGKKLITKLKDKITL